jgi:hypothetical protein
MITEAYVAGLHQENARKLLDRAHELGLPASVVRTVDGGFIVPAVLVEDPPPTPEPAPKRRTPRKAATKTQSADDSTADAVASEE